MGIRLADPDLLDKIAKSLDQKAGAVPGLRRRAAALDAGEHVSSGLTGIAVWAGDTAKDLRKRSRLLRAPSESPFAALKAYGLPADGAAKDTAEGKKLAAKLRRVLDQNKQASPKQRAQEVKDFFSGLSPEEQASLVAASPEAVGNLDGAPVNVRYAANRIRIQAQFKKEKEFFDSLPKNDPRYKRTQKRVAALRSFLTPRLRTSRDPETGREATTEVPRQFLVFDAEYGSTADPKQSPFPDGRVAEVVGDLEQAKDVAFRVPGITNRLDNFDEFAGGGYELASRNGMESDDTAVVNWLGYDTPELGDSVDPAKAEVGGRQLNAFRQGISVNMNPQAKVNIFAHSYGTLATSKALQHGMKNVDTVTFMGSPGLGPNINSVADFKMPNTKFYALRAKGDPVSYTQGHGKDPADFPDIKRLDAGTASGHSEYYHARTESLLNLQRVLYDGGKGVTFTDTTLDEEMTGAAEMRKLVGFLHSKVPPDVVDKMGGDLDPLLQDLMVKLGNMPDDASGTDYAKAVAGALPAIHGVLNKHNMLDRVQPEELRDELVGLGGDIVYKQAYAKLKEKGFPDWAAKATAGTARGAAKLMADGITDPVVKALEIDRLQNNVRQLSSGVWAQGTRFTGDVLAIQGSFNNSAATLAAKTADSVLHPTHVFKNAQDTWKEFSRTKDVVVNKGKDAIGAVADAGKTIADKGGNILDTGKDMLNPFD